MPAGRSSTTRSRSALAFSCDSPCLNNDFLSGFVPRTAGPQSALSIVPVCVLRHVTARPSLLVCSILGAPPNYIQAFHAVARLKKANTSVPE
jgi:hypothetical protein